MKIGVLCHDDGWVYSHFISVMRSHSKNQILLNSKEKCDAYFCLPYYEQLVNTPKPHAVWLSHQENKKELHNKFVSSAMSANIAISHSKKYADMLINMGLTNVIQIMPGVDSRKFALRSSNRPPKDKLVVVFVGRMYSSSSRKNPQLLSRIAALPFVEFKATGGKVREADIPKWLASADLIISPAIYEGGPLALQESLSVGTPFLCFNGVGVANEFEKGIIKVEFNNSDAFISRIEEFWKNQEFLKYRDINVMKEMRKQIESFTWASFVSKLDEAFNKIVNEKV